MTQRIPALALLLLVGGASQAIAEPPPPTCPVGDKTYTEDNPRIQQGKLEIEGRPYRYSVLLPAGYERSRRDYPTLYWLHGAGGNHVSAFTDPATPRFFERLTAKQRVIVVMPEGGWVGMYRDWGRPGHQWETFHKALVGRIEASYRTKTMRRYRAIAGFSMGGMGAITYAARHPELFSQAASFSGLLDTSRRSPTMKAFLSAVGPVFLPACAGDTRVPGTWPDFITDSGSFRSHNPTFLAERLRRTSVHVATGDGVPCDEHDQRALAQEGPTNPLRAMEPFVLEANETFHHAMRDARIAHSYSPYGCGLHSWRYWERELTSWWPRMVRGFTRGRPRSR